MRYTWDPAKDTAIQWKHRISFDDAIEVFDDPLLRTARDRVHSDDEDRMFALGQARAGVLLAISYAVYDNEVRLISARRANSYEARKFMNTRDELRDDLLPDFDDVDTSRVDWNQAKIGPQFKITPGPKSVNLDDDVRLIFYGDEEVNGALRMLIKEGRIPHFPLKKKAKPVTAP